MGRVSPIETHSLQRVRIPRPSISPTGPETKSGNSRLTGASSGSFAVRRPRCGFRTKDTRHGRPTWPLPGPPFRGVRIAWRRSCERFRGEIFIRPSQAFWWTPRDTYGSPGGLRRRSGGQTDGASSAPKDGGSECSRLQSSKCLAIGSPTRAGWGPTSFSPFDPTSWAGRAWKATGSGAAIDSRRVAVWQGVGCELAERRARPAPFHPVRVNPSTNSSTSPTVL